MLTRLIPKLFYERLADGLDLFVDGLGFQVLHQDATLAVVERDGAKAYVVEDAGLAASDRPEIAIETDDIVAIFNEISVRRAALLHPNLSVVTTRPWGAEEFAVLDATGVCVVFRSWSPKSAKLSINEMHALNPSTARLIHERYGAPIAQALLSNSVIDSLLAHRSVRAFTDRPLPAGTLETLVAAGQSAASSSNLQAWSVVAVQDPARKARLAQIAGHQAHIRQAPLLLVWVADLSRLDRVAARRDEASDANRLTEMTLVAIVDAALAAQNAALAAESLGLGTCYIGAMRNGVDRVAAELALPERAFAVFGLCVGHPDPAQPASVKPRLPMSTVLHHEVYTTETEAVAVDGYDEAMLAFQRSQAMKPVPWSQQASARVRGPDSLSGRHALAGWLEARGLPLD